MILLKILYCINLLEVTSYQKKKKRKKKKGGDLCFQRYIVTHKGLRYPCDFKLLQVTSDQINLITA